MVVGVYANYATNPALFRNQYAAAAVTANARVSNNTNNAGTNNLGVSTHPQNAMGGTSGGSGGYTMANSSHWNAAGTSSVIDSAGTVPANFDYAAAAAQPQ